MRVIENAIVMCFLLYRPIINGTVYAPILFYTISLIARSIGGLRVGLWQVAGYRARTDGAPIALLHQTLS